MTADSLGHEKRRTLNPKDKEMLDSGWEFHTNIGPTGISEYLPKYENNKNFKIINEAYDKQGCPISGIAVYRKIKD